MLNLNYQLIRSDRRKTLGLQVKAGSIIVRAPASLPVATINAFIEKKSSWLQRHVALQLQKKQSHASLFITGAKILINGEEKTLRILYQKAPFIQIKENELHLYLSTKAENYNEEQRIVLVKKQLEAWFKSQAEQYLARMLVTFSEITCLQYENYKVRRYKSRWGSCNNKRELSFNSLLIMAPNWVINYVIVHELCHLVHLNHSKQFWSLVEDHYPNYRAAKLWLKENTTKLQWC